MLLAAAATAAVTATDETTFAVESTVKATIILAIGVAIILLNIIVITTFSNIKESANEVVNIYLVSLSVADLVCGIVVFPLSVYPALVNEWVYGDIICRITGFVESVAWVGSAYTFMWISVDRYVAIRRPLRYDTVQTKTRCQCWMAFTWLSSAMMCSPPLLDFGTPIYDKDSCICFMNWERMIAYSATLTILVLGPSLITIVYTYTYVYVIVRRLRSGVLAHDKEYVTALTEALAHPSHNMSFVLILTFWALWSPFMLIKAYEQLIGHRLNAPPYVQFVSVWMGFSHCVWKSFIFLFFSSQFRLTIRLVFRRTHYLEEE